MTHYRCTVCGWTWGDERAMKDTRCPVQTHHKALLRAKKTRRESKEPTSPVHAGSVLAMALGEER